MNFEITELSDFSGEMAHIYSVTLKGDEQTLLEQFFDENADYEDPVLNAKAVQMREIAARINKAIIEKDIVIEQDGSLTINYWEDEDD